MNHHSLIPKASEEIEWPRSRQNWVAELTRAFA
jgi:hypothetical protein